MRPSSPAASPVLLVVAKDGNELTVGDRVDTLDLGEDEDAIDAADDVPKGDDDDLLVLIGSPMSLRERFSDRTGFTKIHFGVASDAARRIKQAVDVKKDTKVRIRRDFSMEPGGLYRDMV